jgi:signal transduction histidine kinase
MVEQRTNDLIQINATKDKLFAIIAHDLKNPFNVILGYSELIISKFETWSNQEKIEMLSVLRDASEKAYNLLENLLNWSQSQRGTLKFEPENLITSDILSQAFADISSVAGKKGVTLQLDKDTEDTTVSGDRNMIQLVCRNLLMNAVKFSNPGSVITCCVKNLDEKSVLFSIQDQGIGMSKEKIKTLFNVQQNESSNGTNGEKGTGLGLVLCYDFILKQGGKIWVESQPLNGTTFYFTIPRIQAEA